MKLSPLPDILNYIREGDSVIEPVEESHRGLSVPDLILRYGNKSGHLKNALKVLPYIVKSVVQAHKSYRSLKYNPHSRTSEISEVHLEKFAEYAKFLGVSQMGFTRVPPSCQQTRRIPQAA